MVNKLFEHIGTKVVLANPWLDTYSVNCIELPLKDGEKRIVNIEGDEKEDLSINDVSGNGFYIKINPRFTYTEQRQVSSSQKDFLVSIRFRFVFFGINTEIEYSKLGLENKFGTAFRNISFSDYIGNERSIKLNISQTNIDAVQIFKEEVGKDYDFGAESVFVALDGVLSFISTDNYCDSECGIAVSESTLKTLDFCDPAIIALLNAKQRECLENEFGGGGISCDDVAACPVITEIQTDLATETSERISEDAALLALIQAIAPTLAQVLANANTTNETAIISNNGKSQIKANNAESLLRFIDGVTSGGITNNLSKTKIDHTSEVEIDSPLIRLVIGHLEGNLLKAKLALLDSQSSLTFEDLTVISGVVADIARHESFFFDGTVYASLKHETAKSSLVHPTLIELTAPSVKINSDQALAYKWYNDVNANSNGIINLRDAVAPQEPITKSQFDSYNASVGRQRGAIDCSSNPNYPASNVGDRWEVTVAGKIGGASGIDVQVYDEIVCKTQSVAGDQATVGMNFYVIQGNLERASETVSGYTQYATDAEVQAGTENTKAFTSLKLENWWVNIKTLALTFAAKITFTSAPRFNSTTASQRLEVDSNKDLISVAKGTADNKNFGTSSGTVCEGNDSRLNRHEITMLKSAASPLLASTSYYLGIPVLAWSTSTTQRRFNFESIGIVDRVTANITLNNNASNNATPIYLRNNTAGTETLLGNIDFSFGANSSKMFDFSGLNISVPNITDEWLLRIDCPAYGTAPTNTFWAVKIYNKIS